MTEAAAQQDSEYAIGWKPTPGDKVGGKVISVDARDGSYGVYPIVTLEDEGGTQVAVHAYHTVLRQKLAKRRPKVGDELEITYIGRKGDGGSFGNGYEAYRVSGGELVGYNWDLDLPEEERQNAATEVPIAPAPVPATPATPEPAGEQFGDKPPF